MTWHWVSFTLTETDRARLRLGDTQASREQARMIQSGISGSAAKTKNGCS
jgi:hypothetical protein